MGLRRCGVPNPSEVVGLAQRMDRLPGLQFQGILFYPGHIWKLPEQQGPAQEELSEKTDAVITALERAGLDCAVVSGGSTPTARNSHLARGLKGIRTELMSLTIGTKSAWEPVRSRTVPYAYW